MEKQLSFFNNTPLIETIAKAQESIHELIDAYWDEDSPYYCDDYLVLILIGVLIDAIKDKSEEIE